MRIQFFGCVRKMADEQETAFFSRFSRDGFRGRVLRNPASRSLDFTLISRLPSVFNCAWFSNLFTLLRAAGATITCMYISYNRWSLSRDDRSSFSALAVRLFNGEISENRWYRNSGRACTAPVISVTLCTIRNENNGSPFLCRISSPSLTVFI